MEVGWFCDTPYQIINCLAYVLNHLDKGTKYDLYILHQFANSDEIVKNIRELGIFRNIISFRKSKFEEENAERIIRKIIRIFFPRHWLNQAQDIHSGVCKIPKQYDALFVSIWTSWNIALYFSVNIKQVNFFEDGTGSYFRDLSVWQSRGQIVHRLLRRDLDNLKPKALYLNNPSLCKVKTDCPIYSLQGLTAISPDGREKLYQAFNYKNDAYYAGYRIIYLTQPNDNNTQNMEKIDDEILRLMTNYGKEVLLRPHPRQKSFSQEEVLIDTHQDMWELVCADQITDSHVLVSIFSTAQITPKLLFNKEPYLIFLYNLYLELLPQMRGEILEFIERIQNIYSRPEKVFLPNTFEELKDCIDQIVENRGQDE